MSETTSRTLRLLSLLQTHRHWVGRDLAERLGVTERTVRRDIDGLRELGYRIESTPGVLGGYRLEAGSTVPPLLLDDDEAVAIAVGLRVAAAQRLVGGPDTTISALAKLEQVLPAALRRQVSALATAMTPSAPGQGAPVEAALLGELGLACRDNERLRFSYTALDGTVSARRVEPHALAPAARNWYLVAWDLDRQDWRTFRVDRIAEVFHTRVMVPPRPLDEEATRELILVATSWARQNIEASVVMDLPLPRMEEHFGAWAQGATDEGDGRTRWPIGGSDWREAMYGMLYVPAGVGYTVDFPEPHRSELREALVRMLAALDAGS